MTTLRRALLPLAAAVLLAPPLAAQKGDTTVALRFDWAPGTTAKVELEKVRVRRTAARVDSMRSRMAYTMSVEAHPEGRRVRWTDFAWVEVPDLPGPDEFMRHVTQAIAILPTLVVSPRGAVVRTEDLVQTRTLTGAMLTRVVAANLRDAPRGTFEIFEQVTPDRVLDAIARQDWDAQVGVWIGAELEPGREYTGESREPSPLNPALTIPSQLRFSMGARVPCAPGAAEWRCVELRFVSRPEPVAFRRALSDIMAQLGVTSADADSLAQGLSKEVRVDAVVEPATLRPHRVTIMQSVGSVEPGPDGKPRPATQADRKTYRYTYQN